MAIIPEYRIIEVTQYGRTWYELQTKAHESDYRDGSYPVWMRTPLLVKTNEFSSLEEARKWRDDLKKAVRVERVIE
jgi:hypothetical protein